MLAAPACYFKYQSLRRQYAPQHFEYRLAVASDVRIVQAWIGFADIRKFKGSARRQLVEENLGLFSDRTIFGKALRILGHAEFFEPLRNLLHCVASLRWSLRRTSRRYPTDAPR